MMRYRIKIASREYYLARSSLASVAKVARKMLWQMSPGQKALIYRGKVPTAPSR